MAPTDIEDAMALREAYDLLPAPVWISTIGERKRWFNKAWLNLAGRDPSVPVLSDWKDDIDPADSARLQELEVQRPSQTGPFRAAYRLRLKDGSLRRLEEVAAARLSRENALIGYVGVCHETIEPMILTSGRRPEPLDAHDALILDTLLNGIAHHAVFLMDPDGTILTWNKGAIALKGYSPWEIVGQPFQALFSAEDRAAGLPNQILAEAAAKGHFEGEGWRLRKDGGRFWAQVAVDSVRDREGRLLGFAKITRDLSKQRETLLQLEEARNSLFQAQKMEAIGHLTGGVAHDFNNLLTVILGNASTLQQELVARPDIKPLADMTRLAAERGATLAGQLLAFARRQPLAPEPVDVNRSVSAMDGLLRRSLGDHIDIELIRGGGLWPALADPPQLEAAILNLCLNARDAMPEGGKVTIETANVFLDHAYASRHADVRAGQYVMVAVSDTGIGMAPDVAARAFDPFFTTKPPGKGSGLGLSMVHGFVKQSGGHVKIYSEPGHGTTIKVYLPRSDVEAAEAPTTATSFAVPGGSRVLVVEDDDLVRHHVIGQLRSLGFEVESARSGREALAKLAQGETFDLLFTDVVMPGMSGRQLADEARRIRPDLPVLFTSGYTENAIIHHGRLDKGVHLLTKPYTRDDLAAKLREAIGEAARGAPRWRA